MINIELYDCICKLEENQKQRNVLLNSVKNTVQQLRSNPLLLLESDIVKNFYALSTKYFWDFICILCDTYSPLITALYPNIFKYLACSNGDLYGYFNGKIVIMIDLLRKTYQTPTFGKNKIKFYSNNINEYCEKQKEILNYVNTYSKIVFKSYYIRQGLRAAPELYESLERRKQGEITYQKRLYNERKKECRKFARELNNVSVFLNSLGYEKM